MSEYWVYTWLDNHRVRTINEVATLLSRTGVLDELKESAYLVVESWRRSPVEAKPLSLVAGAGIDLSGRLDCNASECRRAQVDRLFRRAWHYFPTIIARDAIAQDAIAQGAIAQDLINHSKCPDQEVQERLLPHFETALIVRELGAEVLVEFLPRVPTYFEHWQQHAKEAGIEDMH
jgi:hypothetical protein